MPIGFQYRQIIPSLLSNSALNPFISKIRNIDRTFTLTKTVVGSKKIILYSYKSTFQLFSSIDSLLPSDLKPFLNFEEINFNAL